MNATVVRMHALEPFHLRFIQKSLATWKCATSATWHNPGALVISVHQSSLDYKATFYTAPRWNAVPENKLSPQQGPETVIPQRVLMSSAILECPPEFFMCIVTAFYISKSVAKKSTTPALCHQAPTTPNVFSKQSTSSYTANPPHHFQPLLLALHLQTALQLFSQAKYSNPTTSSPHSLTFPATP